MSDEHRVDLADYLSPLQQSEVRIRSTVWTQLAEPWIATQRLGDFMLLFQAIEEVDRLSRADEQQERAEYVLHFMEEVYADHRRMTDLSRARERVFIARLMCADFQLPEPAWVAEVERWEQAEAAAMRAELEARRATLREKEEEHAHRRAVTAGLGGEEAVH